MASVALAAVALAVLLIAPADGYAQAWLPLPGEGSVSVSFQGVNADGHFLEDGSRLSGYRTRARNLVTDVTYGLSERIALGFTLPFVNARYAGPEEPLNLPDNVLDDGSYHGAITDLRFEVRYNVVDRPFVATPFLAASVPSHSYDTLGEAAPGRGFQEYIVGGYAGRLLDPVLPRGFVHTSYAYAFVRQDLDIPLNYSAFGFDAGYFVSPSVPVTFLWRRYWTHGGLSFNELFEAPPEIFVNLDRVVRIKFQHVGLGMAFPLGGSTSVHANYMRFVSGVDAHYGGGFTVGVSWRFHTRTAVTPPWASVPDHHASLHRGLH